MAPRSVFSFAPLCSKVEECQILTPIRPTDDDGEDISYLFLMQAAVIKTMVLLWGLENAQMEAG